MFTHVYHTASKCSILFMFLQEIKKAIISDLIKLGREAGLKSFEQVSTFKIHRQLSMLRHCYIQAICSAWYMDIAWIQKRQTVESLFMHFSHKQKENHMANIGLYSFLQGKRPVPASQHVHYRKRSSHSNTESQTGRSRKILQSSD